MVGTTLSIQDVARIPIAGTVAGAMVGTVARTITGGAIVCGGVNQFVVQKPLLQIGGLHTDLDRVTQSEDLAGAAATDEVVLLVELEEVGLHIAQGDHAFDHGRLDLHVHTPFGEAGDRAFIFIAYLVLHELDHLVLDAVAFGVRRYLLALGSMLALGFVIVLVLTLGIVEVEGQQPVYHCVRIAADRGSEMRVELEREAVVADVVGGVDRLGHRAQGDHLEGVAFRCALCLGKQGVQGLGDLPSVAARPELEAEVADELAEARDLLRVRLAVYTVDKGLGLLVGLAVHPAGSGDELGHGTVRKKHELLDQPVGLLGDFLVNPDRLSGRIHLDFHLRTLETDGS